MRIYVENRYNYFTLKNLMSVLISPYPDAEIVENGDSFRILHLGTFIEVIIRPLEETVYKVIEHCESDDKLDRIREILDE